MYPASTPPPLSAADSPYPLEPRAGPSTSTIGRDDDRRQLPTRAEPASRTTSRPNALGSALEGGRGASQVPLRGIAGRQRGTAGSASFDVRCHAVTGAAGRGRPSLGCVHAADRSGRASDPDSPSAQDRAGLVDAAIRPSRGRRPESIPRCGPYRRPPLAASNRPGPALPHSRPARRSRPHPRDRRGAARERPADTDLSPAARRESAEPTEPFEDWPAPDSSERRPGSDAWWEDVRIGRDRCHSSPAAKSRRRLAGPEAPTPVIACGMPEDEQLLRARGCGFVPTRDP